MKHQQVVVAYDFSELGAAVLARAVSLVSRAPQHILHFVTVIDAHDYEVADKVRDQMSDAVRRAFGDTPIPEEVHFFAHARIGKPDKEILDLAEELGADLILIGTHGRTGVSRLMMGSVAERVVREAGCPVLVVRPKRYEDVELATITTLEDHVPRASRTARYSYSNSSVIMRPNEWPIP